MQRTTGGFTGTARSARPRIGSALAAIAILVAVAAAGAGQTRKGATLKVTGATPGAIVLVDAIRHGRADATGAKTIATLAPGRHEVAVRMGARGEFRRTVAVPASRPAVVRVGKIAAPSEAEAAFLEADDLAYAGKNAEAAPLFERAIALKGGSYPAAEIGLARAYLATKQTDKAAAAINALLAASPQNAEALAVSANILRDRGFYEEAAEAYRKAIAIAPKSTPEAHTGLAILLEERGDHENAIANFRLAIAQNADAEPILYQLLGQSLEQAGRADEAIEAYRGYLALAPNGALAPAVRSIVEQLRSADPEAPAEEGDVNPFARPQP